MAYQKTTWVDGQTPITAQALNNMENGISASATSASPTFSGTITLPYNAVIRIYTSASAYIDIQVKDLAKIVIDN